MLNKIRRGRTRRWLAASGIAVVSTGAVVAWAADTAPDQNGLMTFPNVRVVSMPSAPANAGAAGAADSGSGFKIYTDPATGRRVQPTHEAAAALNATARAQARLQAAEPPLTVTSPDGGVGVHRDESRMPYLVARRNADGTLTMACVPAEHAATAWLEKGSDGVTTRRARKGEVK
jgi:hypothetical protein